MWFRIDDSIASHPKALIAGDSALGYWLRVGAWCSQHLTDGWVPEEIARSMGTPTQRNRLVGSGLWVPNGSGYRFHDWEDYNPSGKQVEQLREHRAEAGRQANHKRWHVLRKVTDPECPYCITIR